MTKFTDPLHELRQRCKEGNVVAARTAMAAVEFAEARIGRLREMALASVRPAGLITSPESVRWFNARNKCDAQNDLTPSTAEGASDDTKT